jgi:hypothetical protein
MRCGLVLLGLVTAGLAMPATVAQAATPSGFTVASSANLGGASAYFNDVTTPTSSSGWIVGSINRPTDPGAPWALMEQWNGTSWSRIGLPSLPPTAIETHLVSISSTTPTDAWAVGWSVTKTRPRSRSSAYHQLVYRRTAAGWKRVTIATYPGALYNQVRSVSVASPTNVWALAVTDLICMEDVLHYDGTHWSEVDSYDQCDAGTITLYDHLTATGASTGWAVGGGATDYESQGGGLATCFGSPCPAGSDLAFAGGLNGQFAASAGTRSDLWALGSNRVQGTAYEPMIWHWNGSAWQDATPGFADESQSVDDGVLLPNGDLWTAGYRTTVRGDRTWILEHSLSGWHGLGGPNSGTADNQLYSIAHVGGTATGMWAVGAAGDQPLLLRHP